MERRKFLIGTAGAAATAAVGSLAYTSATVNRDVDVQVTTDDGTDAALQFQASEGTAISSNGQLVINGESDGSGGSAKFVTPDGSFVFGDPNSPSTTFAFSMTNQLASSRSFDITLANVSPSGGNVTIEFFDSSGASQQTADKDSGISGMSISSGTTYYAVVTIDTGVDDTNVTADLTISAN